MGRSAKNIFLDKLHRRSVQGIFIFSGFCTLIFAERFYNFMFNVRPRLRETRFEAEQEILSEGKASEEEFAAA